MDLHQKPGERHNSTLRHRRSPQTKPNHTKPNHMLHRCRLPALWVVRLSPRCWRFRPRVYRNDRLQVLTGAALKIRIIYYDPCFLEEEEISKDGPDIFSENTRGFLYGASVCVIGQLPLKSQTTRDHRMQAVVCCKTFLSKRISDLISSHANCRRNGATSGVG